MALALFLSVPTWAAESIETQRLKLYVDKDDPQPRCMGCKTVRIVADSKALPVGQASIQTLQARIVSTNLPDRVAAFVEFSKVEGTGKKNEFRVLVRVPSLLSRELDGLSLVVEGWGLKCVNSANLNCSFLETHDTLTAELSRVFELEAR